MFPLTVDEFIVNKLETAILCSEQKSYSISELNDIIDLAIEDYEYEYQVGVSYNSDRFKLIKPILKSFKVEVTQ